MNVKYYKVQVVSKNLNIPMHGFTILTTRSFILATITAAIIPQWVYNVTVRKFTDGGE